MGKHAIVIVNQWDLYVKWDGMKVLRLVILGQPMMQDVLETDVECHMAFKSVAVQLEIVSQ